GLGALFSNPLLRPSSIIDRMVRLHRRDHFVARETRDVLWSNVLSVFDAKAPVTCAVFLFNLLEDRKDQIIGAIADGVYENLKSRAIGTANAFKHRTLRKHLVAGNPTRLRRVFVRLVEQRCG